MRITRTKHDFAIIPVHVVLYLRPNGFFLRALRLFVSFFFGQDTIGGIERGDRLLSDTSAANILPYTIAPSRRGSGFLAIATTCFVPGLGQFLAGSFRRGIIWLLVDLGVQVLSIAMICSPRLLLPGIVLFGFSFVLPIVIAIDAFFVTRRSTRLMFRATSRRYIYGVLFICLGYGRFIGEMAITAPLIQQYVRIERVFDRTMTPTLMPGDWMLISPGSNPKRWDVVSMEDPRPFNGPGPFPPFGEVSLLRVVGLPYESVEITRRGLLINSKPIQLPAKSHPYAPGTYVNAYEGSPTFLGYEEYFVLGDNPQADDSRYWAVAPRGHETGALPANDIIGIVRAVVWPPSHFKIIKP